MTLPNNQVEWDGETPQRCTHSDSSMRGETGNLYWTQNTDSKQNIFIGKNFLPQKKIKTSNSDSDTGFFSFPRGLNFSTNLQRGRCIGSLLPAGPLRPQPEGYRTCCIPPHLPLPNLPPSPQENRLFCLMVLWSLFLFCFCFCRFGSFCLFLFLYYFVPWFYSVCMYFIYYYYYY